MKTIVGPIVFLTLLLMGCTASNVEKELFVSEDGDTWISGGTANWNWNDGEITGESTSGSSFLMTTESYRDFELSLEFYPDSTVNSGIFIRCSQKEVSAVDCYEFNIWDLHPNQDYRTGALVGKADPLNFVETLYQWNTYVIKVENGKLQAWINEVQTVDFIDEELIEGFVAIQAGQTGKIRFRNINIRYPSR